jgi:hypothetical protein
MDMPTHDAPPPVELPAPVLVHDRLRHPVAQTAERQPGDPPYRRLRVFTSDPVAKRFEGRSAVAHVDYEPLALEPADPQDGAQSLCGRIFEVCMLDADGSAHDPPHLDEASQLLQDGYAPSESNPRFYAQMVYAVASQVHAAFRYALGREPGWSFGRSGAAPARLRMYPLGTREANAWYDSARGELRFGYVKTARAGWVFTALSHDIVAHEIAHALLDSQRPRFMEPTSHDVPGFHEGFADLVALFQHFQYPHALRDALQASKSVVVPRETGETATDWLCCIARQFGQTGDRAALRRADGKPTRRPDSQEQTGIYRHDLEEHDMGEVLLAAVFDAFDTVYRRRTARLRRLATSGSGVLPQGSLAPDLLDALADEAALLARQFTAIVVRAIDYCPPADIKLGEFLRAMVTADTELRPDDPWAIREALIDAFRVREIVPSHVISLSEDALVWAPPRRALPPALGLSFARTQFASTPGRPLPVSERLRQAAALGGWLMLPGVAQECGVATPEQAVPDGEQLTFAPPSIDAIEITRRVAPNGEVLFETVAVVTQNVSVAPRDGLPGFQFVSGGTLLFAPDGTLRLAITKHALGEDRIARRRAFITGKSTVARRYWERRDAVMVLKAEWSRSMCVHETAKPQAQGPA